MDMVARSKEPAARVIEAGGAAASPGRTGAGATIVLVPGSRDPREPWRAAIERLSGAFRVAVLDLHDGGGRFSRPGDGGPADEAGIVRAAIDTIGAPVHLVGLWFGGAIALRIAMEAPQRLASLTLIEPVAFDPPARGPARRAFPCGVELPTLIVRGTASPAPVRHSAALLSRAIPGAHFICIEGAGHELPITHPLDVDAALRGHLLGAADGWRGLTRVNGSRRDRRSTP